MKIEEVKELTNEFIKNYLAGQALECVVEIPIVIKKEPYLIKKKWHEEKTEEYEELFDDLSQEEKENIFKYTNRDDDMFYLTISKIDDDNYVFLKEFDDMYIYDDELDLKSMPFIFLENVKNEDISANIICLEGVTDIRNCYYNIKRSSLRFSHALDLQDYLKMQGYSEKIIDEEDLVYEFMIFVNNNIEHFIDLDVYKTKDEIMNKLKEINDELKHQFELDLLEYKSTEISDKLYDFFYNYEIKAEDCDFIKNEEYIRKIIDEDELKEKFIDYVNYEKHYLIDVDDYYSKEALQDGIDANIEQIKTDFVNDLLHLHSEEIHENLLEFFDELEINNEYYRWIEDWNYIERRELESKIRRAVENIIVNPLDYSDYAAFLDGITYNQTIEEVEEHISDLNWVIEKVENFFEDNKIPTYYGKDIYGYLEELNYAIRDNEMQKETYFNDREAWNLERGLDDKDELKQSWDKKNNQCEIER